VSPVRRGAGRAGSGASAACHDGGIAVSLHDQVVDIVRRRGLRRLPEPVVLASGQLSRDFVDVKVALARGDDLRVACEALMEQVAEVDYDAIGGLTMGADQFAHGVAVLAGKDWFVVRKEPKGRGTNKLVEGATVGEGTRVLLVDDVVTTGGSIRRAYEVITGLGATVVAAVTLVDRGEVAGRFFREEAIAYFPMVTYRDLGIDPIG
jgi:orotate phosphoribosyltransferase